jgi:MFS family permease
MYPKQYVTESTARRNIRLFVVQKIFVKRVFIPITAIYFTEVAGFSLNDIALVAIVFAGSQLIAELPTGYFADRVARVTSIRLAAILNICSTLLYAFMPTTAGILTGIVIEAIGYAFLAGASEALLHDTLDWQKKGEQYTKVSSRAQSISLVANMILVAVIPLTYTIDKRLPFIFGTVAYICLLVTSLLMREVKRFSTASRSINWQIAKRLITKKFAIFLLIFGMVSALQNAPVDYMNLTFRELGLRPEYLGWIYAAVSGFGAIIGPFIHHLKRLSLPWYMVLDGTLCSLQLIILLTGSLPIIIGVFILNFAFWRYRKIIYQDHLLNKERVEYKATMLSLLNNVSQVNELWLPVVFASMVGVFGLQSGLGYVGLASLPLIFLSFVAGKLLLSSGTGKKPV